MEDQQPDTTGRRFERLVEIMARLRAPGGCPWDREQTFDTIKPYLLEETYEVMDAIDARDWDGLAGELGDLLLQAVFFSQMAAEEGLFRHRRFARRHQREAGPPPSARLRRRRREDRRRRAQQLGRDQGRGEEADKATRRKACSTRVPRSLPALVEAQQIASRAAQRRLRLGECRRRCWKSCTKSWPSSTRRAQSGSQAEIEDEMGDLLFVLVNMARFRQSGSRAGAAQDQRQVPPPLRHVEQRLAERGKSPREATIEEMEALWQEAKSRANDRASGALDRAAAEFDEAVELQKTIWGFDDVELLPVRLFVVATKIGGQAFGAFDGERMVGFCLAIPGLKAAAADRICTATCWACCRSIAIAASAAC